MVGASPVAFGAINSGCSITPTAPYKSGATFVYGGSIGCSSAVASRIDATGQRQTTLSWVAIGSKYNTSAWQRHRLGIADRESSAAA